MFKEGSAEVIAKADKHLKRVLNTTSVSDLVDRTSNLLDGAKWNGDDLDYATGYVLISIFKVNWIQGKILKH